MRKIKTILVLLISLAICGCSLLTERETPDPLGAPVSAKSKAHVSPLPETAVSPAVSVVVSPEHLLTVNLYDDLGLSAARTVELIPNMPGGTNVIIEGALAQRLASALDADIVLSGRARCMPTYNLVFCLADGQRVELGVVGCDLEHPPLIRGEQALFGVQDAQANVAMGRALAEIINPMLPHPSPTQAPVEPGEQFVPAEVLGAFEQALALFRQAHPDHAPSTDLEWTIVPATPEGEVGAAHYEATTTDWGAQIMVPEVAPEYRNYVYKFFCHADAFEWVVRVSTDGYEILSGETVPPAPTPDADAVPEEIHDALGVALTYLHATYGDVAPAQGLDWTITYVTPEGLVGGGWYDIAAPGWEGRILAPVVAPQHQTYDVKLRDATGREWVVVVDAQGHVQEQPAAAAGAVQMVSHECADKSFTVTCRTDWRMDDSASAVGHEGVVALARDGWRLVIHVATRQEDLEVLGGAAGEWQSRQPVAVGSDMLGKQALVYQDRVKAIKYHGEIAGRIVYVHLLDQMRVPYDQIHVPVGLEHEVDTIVRSLSLN